MSGGFTAKKPWVNKKLMHPRNIYQNRVDFTLLAKDYPEFRKIAKQDIRGKVTIDFKDEESLRILNKTLLKKDFGLDVNIPPGYLVPTISLRLNYILWLEDILQTLKPSNEIHGIDIGTGASCVYMLLGAQKNKWYMIGTEIDSDSIKYAEENIKHNNLEHLLKVKLTKSENPLFNFLNEDNKEYHFCVCNPPFYSISDVSSQRRSSDCPSPKNVQTGKHSELSTDGGEIEFITRIIKESLQWKTKIKIYTTMVGHKKNVFYLLNLLKEEGIKKYVSTEFVQGHTSRWAIAWTFLEDIKLEDMGTGVTALDVEANNASKNKNKNAQKPIIFQFTNPDRYPEKEDFLNYLKQLFRELKLKFREIIKKNLNIFEVTAFENTWSHQRQKRREIIRRQKQAGESSSSAEDLNLHEFFDTASSSNDNKKRPAASDLQSEYPATKRPKLVESEITLNEPIVKFEMTVQLNDLDYYQLALIHIEGNKDAMYQILQFLKNRISK